MTIRELEPGLSRLSRAEKAELIRRWMQDLVTPGRGSKKRLEWRG